MADRDDEVIRSSDNRTLKLIRSLRLRKVREAERAFVVEGIRAVEDALLAGGNARVVLVRDHSAWSPPAGIGPVAVRVVAPALFDSLSETMTPQPVLAVFERPDVVFPDEPSPLVLVIDGMRDPGNLGTLLRSAAGAGVAIALVTNGTVDPFNGKSIRAGMGAQFRLPVTELDSRSLGLLRARCTRFVLAESRAEAVYTDVEWRGPVALIVGSEAEGPTEVGLSLATETVRIPLQNGVESLNASVAGSILLFEAARRRKQTSRHSTDA